VVSAARDENLPLERCPRCGCRDLFVRKDFPQKLGLAIVVVAAAAFLWLASSRTHFYLGAIVLLAAALIDAALYAFVPTITVCYRCRAEFRDAPRNPAHQGFELAIAEKYRVK
jgi:DNA-directed RNA polymerase subunit RPC12/RpoP